VRPENFFLILAVIFFLFIHSGYSQLSNFQKYAATDTTTIAEMTVEEMQFYQSDYFPLSLGEKGRQSATAWHGMPPGFLDYEYDRMTLRNPLWGFFDNQILPTELIRQRKLDPFTLQYNLIPVLVKENVKPVTRVTYSQDFQFGLSYLDASLTRFYRPKSYVKLSGNNILRSGSSQEFTKFQVNTYRVPLHHYFSPKFQMDIRYWQLRHNYRISPYPEVSIIRKVKDVDQILWLNLEARPDSNNQIILTPYASTWGEHYRTIDYSEQRKNKIYTGGIKFQFIRKMGEGKFLITSDLKRDQITSALVLNKKGQWSERLNAEIRIPVKSSELIFGAGYHYYQNIGHRPEFNFNWKMKLFLDLESRISLVSKPQDLPLAAIYWKPDSIRTIGDGEMPMRSRLSWQISRKFFTQTRIKVEPFYARFNSAWSFDPNGSRFYQRDFKNSGLSASLYSRPLGLFLSDEFTWSTQPGESMMPEFNNVVKLGIPLAIFNRALKLRGYAIYHFIGNWQQVEFFPFVNQYAKTNLKKVNYHLLDFKILANVKSATLFFVWENMLSEDYAIIEGYFEVYRQFRFGVYWTLFN